MSWHVSLLRIFDIILRVPSLFVMDSLLNQTFLFPWMPDDLSRFSFVYIIWMLMIISSFIAALVIFLLPTKQIIDIYGVLLSLFVLWFSYWFNLNFISLHTPEGSISKEYDSYFSSENHRIVFNILTQIALAFSYNCFRIECSWFSRVGYIQTMRGILQASTYLFLLQTIVWSMIGVPHEHLQLMPLSSVVGVILEMCTTLVLQSKSIMLWFKRCYMTTRYSLRNYGIQVFLENQWIRLNVPSVLRVFWITRTVYHLTYLTVFKIKVHSDAGEPYYYLNLDDTLDILKSVIITGCETTVALLGMTSIVSSITHYIGLLMAWFIGSTNEEDRNMGTVSAILFFILALQTGLTSLDEEQRIIRLYRNFCLLSTAILHFVHTMINPLLMNLSASHLGSWTKHARVLAMCLFLLIFPAWFLKYLWSQHSVSTWILAVTAFSIEVIIKVIISLLVYILFMTDAYRESFWEKLDDYVYYIKSTGNTIEFTFGIFLFGNGAWIMIFESGGAIRAAMMLIHAYFNIWVQAKDGWKVFMKRRTAVNKINSLPIATENELRRHNDVCAICYQELVTARVTVCKHMFHGVCLRKWLYVQDTCPMCYKLIYSSENQEQSADVEENGNEPVVDNNGGAVVPLNNINFQEELRHRNPVPVDDDA